MREFILTLVVGCVLMILVWMLLCKFERSNWMKRIKRGYRGVKCKYWEKEDSFIGTITSFDEENEEVVITTMYHGIITRNINDINPH